MAWSIILLMLVTVKTLKLNDESGESDQSEMFTENGEFLEDELEGECEKAKLPTEARLRPLHI